MKYTTGETLAKSITYAHLLEEAFCVLERTLQFQALFCSSVFNFVHVIPCVPENLTIAELVVSGFDEVIMFHTTIIAYFDEIVKGKNSNEINDLRSPPLLPVSLLL